MGKRSSAILTIEVDGTRRSVSRADYVTAKTKQLREFGYPSLKESSVSEQLDRLLAGKRWSTVIGCLMESDKPKKERGTQ